MVIIPIACLSLACIFGILGVVFALLKEKGATLVSGFNTLPNKENYDKEKISIDMRNSLFIWFGILLLGAVLSHFINNRFGIGAIILWIILFFKDVHLNPEKAFHKYKKYNV